MGLLALIPSILGLFDKILPDSAKRDEFAAQLQQLALEANQKALELQADENKAQAAVNQVEAASNSLFVSGWRPATGWVCLLGLVFSIFLPMINSILINHGMAPIESGDSSVLTSILFGMLGLGHGVSHAWENISRQ